MFKIIKIENDIIYVGKGSDGQFTEIPRNNFGFEPTVGDFVEFYQNDGTYIVSKVENIAHFASGGLTSQQGQKSKVVAGILALLLGGIGAYDFYIGSTGKGFLRLGLSLLGLIPFLFPVVVTGNLIANIIIGISVLTSKPGSKYHKDANGLELVD
ncbi:TPA: TM2 domain-containing protein [Streptococcus suis]|nr:TM2 domain-containing protein [Streptococcus suis]HEM5148190.1 TM2 domain-containing protein [Streptococcus suis]HEM5149470.1 TM2 domain-containing protein [Streptococcus suis]HEM5204665.1 TM2 domain-containing protein [Streptococcus suis]HEM5209122.1 TM2 domain-containing protein [Streptococcus suis]